MRVDDLASGSLAVIQLPYVFFFTYKNSIASQKGLPICTSIRFSYITTNDVIPTKYIFRHHSNCDSKYVWKKVFIGLGGSMFILNTAHKSMRKSKTKWISKWIHHLSWEEFSALNILLASDWMNDFPLFLSITNTCSIWTVN